MQKVNTAVHYALYSMLLCFSVRLSALTIEDIAVKNNKIIELDQDIAIAEKYKKLAEIKNSSMQSETLALPRLAAMRRDQNMAVISVHGAPGNPVVDVQYGDTVFQKQIGDVMPDGWRISAIGTDSVTFRKKIKRKPDFIKTTGIGIVAGTGSDSKPAVDDAGVFSSPREPVPVPAPASINPVAGN